MKVHTMYLDILSRKCQQQNNLIFMNVNVFRGFIYESSFGKCNPPNLNHQTVLSINMHTSTLALLCALFCNIYVTISAGL